MRQKQVIALVLAVVMLVCVLAGCGNKEEGLKVKVNGKNVVIDNIATIGGIDVPIELYRYFFMNIKYSYDQGDNSLWEVYPDQVQAVKYYALNYMQNYASTLVLVEKYGIELSEADKESIENNINTAINNAGSYANFKKQLEANYLTEDLYRTILEMELYSAYIQNAMFGEGSEYYITDAQLNEFIKKDYIRTRHILIPNSTEDRQSVIDEVQSKIDAGEDFQTLAEQYSSDTASSTNYPDGQCYTEGKMIDAFYNAAKKTEVGQIGTVDTEEYGYFFIEKLPLDDEYITNNHEALYQEYCSSVYNEVVGAMMDEIGYSYHEAYEAIDIKSFS